MHIRLQSSIIWTQLWFLSETDGNSLLLLQFLSCLEKVSRGNEISGEEKNKTGHVSMCSEKEEDMDTSNRLSMLLFWALRSFSKVAQEAWDDTNVGWGCGRKCPSAERKKRIWIQRDCMLLLFFFLSNGEQERVCFGKGEVQEDPEDPDCLLDFLITLHLSTRYPFRTTLGKGLFFKVFY